MKEEKKLRVLDSNLLYLICGILFVTVGAYFQKRELLSGLIITQYLIILAPPIIYLSLRKISIKKTLKINPISFKHGLMVALITILMYPAALFANTAFMFLLSLLGNLDIPQIPMPENIREYIVMMAIVSITAGICEEVLFRGFVMSGYERLGKKRAIFISAILFGLFHLNIYNLLGPIVLGLVFGYLVMITDSIFAGIIGHMINNGFALTLGFGVNYILQKINVEQFTKGDSPEVSTTMSLIVSTIFFGFLTIATGFIAYHLFKVIKKDMEKKRTQENKIDYEEISQIEGEGLQELEETKKSEYIPLGLMIIVILFFAILQIRKIILLG